jgi:uncharacterized protein (DUF1778 family)
MEEGLCVVFAATINVQLLTTECLFFTDIYRTFAEKNMETLNEDKARFDTRLPKEQKQLFERAARLGGYRNLTDFVISTLQSKAIKIIEENDRILASQQDQEIFFHALINPPKPNKELLTARNDFNKLISK